MGYGWNKHGDLRITSFQLFLFLSSEGISYYLLLWLSHFLNLTCRVTEAHRCEKNLFQNIFTKRLLCLQWFNGVLTLAPLFIKELLYSMLCWLLINRNEQNHNYCDGVSQSIWKKTNRIKLHAFNINVLKHKQNEMHRVVSMILLLDLCLY